MAAATARHGLLNACVRVLRGFRRPVGGQDRLGWCLLHFLWLCHDVHTNRRPGHPIRGFVIHHEHLPLTHRIQLERLDRAGVGITGKSQPIVNEHTEVASRGWPSWSGTSVSMSLAATLGASPESYRTWDAGRRATPPKVLERPAHRQI